MLVLALLACDGGETRKPDATGDSGGEVDCSDVGLQVPTPRGEVVGTWDPLNQRFVVFGGDEGTPVDCSSQTSFTGDTWAWVPACAAFTEIVPDGEGPPARGRHAVAFDPVRNWMIIHGGRYRDGTRGDYTLYDDTWALDLATDTWTKLSDGGPGARVSHAAGVIGNRLVIYGGNDSTDGASYSALKDVWAFDLDSRQWEELSPGAGPGKRLFHAYAVSDDGTRLYAYGGGDEDLFTGETFGDLWELDPDGGWTELHDGTGDAPDHRFWGNLVAEPGGQSLLLWAGHDDTELGNRNDLWRFDLASKRWTSLGLGDTYNAPANGFCDFPADFVNPDLSAPERRNAGAAAMDGDGRLYVFGGKTDCGLINDVWTWSNGWTEASPATSGEICLRAYAECATMCF